MPFGLRLYIKVCKRRNVNPALYVRHVRGYASLLHSRF